MNESQYTYLQKKQWRAITVDWNILSQNSNTNSKLYCLTDFQVAWLLSVTEYFRWSTRWENCPCTQNDLEAMKAEMDYNLMSCFDFQPYQIQTTYQNSQNSLLNTYANDWNGTEPSSVNPDAPDDFFDGDGSPERENGLCTALSLWTYSYATDWAYKAGIVLGLAGVVTAIVDLMIPAGGNIATEVISHLITPTQEELEAMQDIDALNTVICDWKSDLIGIAINPTNWTNAIQSLVYTVGTPEYLIQQILSEDTQLLKNFLSFVNSLGQGYEYAQLGVFICPDCPPETWISVMDFTLDQYGVTFLTASGGQPFGTWTIGVGLQANNVFHDGQNRRQLLFQKDFDLREVNYYKIDGVYTRGTLNTGLTIANQVDLRIGGSLISGTSSSSNFTAFTVGVPVAIQYEKTGLNVNADRFQGNCISSAGNQTGNVIITRLELHGQGTKPPQLP